MSTRQNKKRKGRNHVNNRERTVTTFTEDPNTSFLVPLSSEDPSPFAAASSFPMPYQYNQFYHPVLPPGKNDLEILENLKSIIKQGQHEFYRAVPQPAALAALYVGPIEFHAHDTADDGSRLDATPQSAHNTTTEALTPLSPADTSPSKLGAENTHAPEDSPSLQPDSEGMMTQDPPTDPKGEYGSGDTAPSNNNTDNNNNTTPKDAPKDDQLATENTWQRRVLDDPKAPYDPNTRPDNYDPRPSSTPSEARFPSTEDHRFPDRDNDKDRAKFTDRDRNWDRDPDRHDSLRDIRDRDRDRPAIRDRRPDFFGRSYGRSHAPRPPPELRHYEPSYGPDYVPPPRRFDPDDRDRRAGPRNAPFDDRFKPPPFDDRRPLYDDRRPLPADDRRINMDDRPMRPLPGSSEDRIRPSAPDSIPISRPPTEDDRTGPPNSVAAEDRPLANVPLEERLSQPAPAPSLQDRLSQPVVVPPRLDMVSAPSLEERLSVGPVPPRAAYGRAPSIVRDDLRPPLPKDDLRDHDRTVPDFRTHRDRDFSRERNYRPDHPMDRNFGDRDDRDRRDRDVPDANPPPGRFNDSFRPVGGGPPPLPPPSRRYSPPPHLFDRDRDRDRFQERTRQWYPTRSPPPPTPPLSSSFRGDSVYDHDPNPDRRFTTVDRERDTYDPRREWFRPSGDDDKRGGGLAPPPPSWRPQDRPSFVDRDRDRFDRDWDKRDRDTRDRDRDRDRDVRERDRDLVPWFGDRDRRAGFPPLSPPPPPNATNGRMDTMGPGRSLSARLTDPYLPPGDAYHPPPPSREFDRGRYGGPQGMDDHPVHVPVHGPPPFSRVRNRSPSPHPPPPMRRGGGVDDLRPPPMKRLREDNSGPGYAGYSPSRRPGMGGSVGGGGEYAPGPPPPSVTTATSTTSTLSTNNALSTGAPGTAGPPGPVTGSVVTSAPPRSAGTRTPPVSGPSSSTGASGGFYERERDREREYVRGEYGGMGYDRDRDGRGRRSPPPSMLGSRMGPPSSVASGPGIGGGYGRGVVGDRRDDRRYVPPQPPPRAS